MVSACACHLATCEDACAPSAKYEIYNPNMVYSIEKNTHTKVEARDGREWDALLRARTRNSSAHSKVFGEV